MPAAERKKGQIAECELCSQTHNRQDDLTICINCEKTIRGLKWHHENDVVDGKFTDERCPHSSGSTECANVDYQKVCSKYPKCGRRAATIKDLIT